MWPTDQNRAAWEERFGHAADESAGLPPAVRERLPDVDGRHVLHLGCGTGEATADLLALGALVTGIDPSEEALKAARERVPEAAFFQAALDEIPLQLRRRRFSLVFAGGGTVAGVSDLGLFAAGAAAALRKNGELVVCERHPVAECVEPVGLRWRESYFEECRRRLGTIVTALMRPDFTFVELEELPPPAKERGGRHDPRIPTAFLLRLAKVPSPAPSPRGRRPTRQ